MGKIRNVQKGVGWGGTGRLAKKGYKTIQCSLRLRHVKLGNVKAGQMLSRTTSRLAYFLNEKRAETSSALCCYGIRGFSRFYSTWAWEKYKGLFPSLCRGLEVPHCLKIVSCHFYGTLRRCTPSSLFPSFKAGSQCVRKIPCKREMLLHPEEDLV